MAMTAKQQFQAYQMVTDVMQKDLNDILDFIKRLRQIDNLNYRDDDIQTEILLLEADLLTTYQQFSRLKTKILKTAIRESHGLCRTVNDPIPGSYDEDTD